MRQRSPVRYNIKHQERNIHLRQNVTMPNSRPVYLGSRFYSNVKQRDFDITLKKIEDSINLIQIKNPYAKTLGKVRKELLKMNPNFVTDETFWDVYPEVYELVQARKELAELKKEVNKSSWW